MLVEKVFIVERPISDVWAHLADVPSVAKCLPGAVLDEALGDGRYRGAVSIKVGPINARFSGQLSYSRDETIKSGRLLGSGKDRFTGSVAEADMTYRLVSKADGTTQVEINANVSLIGVLAQFGTRAVINKITERLSAEFASNLNNRLSQLSAPSHVRDAVKCADQDEAVTAQKSGPGLAQRTLAILDLMHVRGRK